METWLDIEIDLICIIILIIVLRNSGRQTGMNRRELGFRVLIYVVLAALLYDIGAWLIDGKLFAGAQRLHYIFSSSIFFLNVFMGYACMRYEFAFFHFNFYKHKILPVLSIIPIIMSIIILCINVNHPLLFVISRQNYFNVLSTAFLLRYMALAGIYILFSVIIGIYRYMTAATVKEEKESLSMIIYLLLPTAGIFIQNVLNMTPMAWIAIMLSILLIFMNFQNDQIYIDALTGIGNRRFLNHYMHQLMTDTSLSQSPYTMVLFDIDKFKLFNDRYGHLAGDDVLIHTADAIRFGCIKTTGKAVRYGGDEFAVVCKEQDLPKILKRTQDKLDLYNKLSTYVPVVLSHGTTEFIPNRSESIEQIITRADVQMYDMKKQHCSSNTNLDAVSKVQP